MATDSAELAQIAAEAKDIAKNVGEQPSTAHLLLATFTVPGAADVLLRERGCGEDQVLAELAAVAPRRRSRRSCSRRRWRRRASSPTTAAAIAPRGCTFSSP